MNPTTPAELTELARETVPHWNDLDWAAPGEAFRIYDDGNPHGRLCIIFPGGQLVDIGCHADPAIDMRRANWICNALNTARARDLCDRTPAGSEMTPELRAAIKDTDAFERHLKFNDERNRLMLGDDWLEKLPR
jgi:hypothetical protein